jgi:transmembrane sensor
MTELDHPSIAAARLEHEAYGWVVRFVSGEAGPGDIEALKAWSAQSPAHAAAFDRASRVWQATGPMARRLSMARSRSTASGVGGQAQSAGQARWGRRAFLGGAAAASAAGVALALADPPLELWPSWSELTADYRTRPGEQRQIMLPGDVSVDMNTRTSIALRSTAKGDRIELVSGEAMIAVPAVSGALTVLAGNGRVIAKSARVNLRRDEQSIRVTCLAGKVQVECGGATLLLPAGQQVAYSDRGFGRSAAVDPAAVTAWQDGIVVFDATPVSKVIEEVNRYRPGRIILTNAALGRERLSARFRIANIGGIVDQIKQVFGARATLLPGGIVLLG